MANIVQAEATNMLNASLGKATYTATVTPLKLKLVTANGTATSAGTEVSGGSYVAQDITSAIATASGGATSNSGVITFTGMPAVTVVGVEIWDSASTPVRKWYGSLTASKTTASGDSISFAVGALTLSLS
ncbi:MAG: hypothetical protein EKK42_20365 [Pseudonocardiaceae bacterium]|nr:MAG: hypothetical protein EKK42_20365 [Pseudonocardiaceae bacterium]